MKGHTEGGDFHPHSDKPGIHSDSMNHNSTVNAPGVQTSGKILKVEEPEPVYYSDKVDKVADEIESEIVQYGADLVLNSGIDKQGIGYLAPIIEWIGWENNLQMVNANWEYVYEQDGEKGLHDEIHKIIEMDKDSALWRLDQAFGYDEPTENDRPKNQGERMAQALLEGFEKMKDEELASYKNREQDYARGKKIINDVYEKQQTLIHNKLPRK